LIVKQEIEQIINFSHPEHIQGASSKSEQIEQFL